MFCSILLRVLDNWKAHLTKYSNIGLENVLTCGYFDILGFCAMCQPAIFDAGHTFWLPRPETAHVPDVAVHQPLGALGVARHDEVEQFGVLVADGTSTPRSASTRRP